MNLVFTPILIALLHFCAKEFSWKNKLRQTKEHKQEAQCAKKGGQMLVFVNSGFIKNFLPNSYFILQIYHVKSF